MQANWKLQAVAAPVGRIQQRCIDYSANYLCRSVNESGVQRIIISAWSGHASVLQPDGSTVPGEEVSTGSSVLAVFQRGQQIWSCAALAQVRDPWGQLFGHTMSKQYQDGYYKEYESSTSNAFYAFIWPTMFRLNIRMSAADS